MPGYTDFDDHELLVELKKGSSPANSEEDRAKIIERIESKLAEVEEQLNAEMMSQAKKKITLQQVTEEAGLLEDEADLTHLRTRIEEEISKKFNNLGSQVRNLKSKK